MVVAAQIVAEFVPARAYCTEFCSASLTGGERLTIQALGMLRSIAARHLMLAPPVSRTNFTGAA